MNCKLCDHSFTDFVIMGVCGRCIEGLITGAVKAKQRAVPVVVDATEGVDASAETAVE